MTTILEPVLNLSNASDSGELEDGITNDATPTYNGVADPGALVRIFDGAAEIAQVMAGLDGTFSVTLPTLSDGEHRLSATATLGGQTSAASEAEVLTIDTQAPSVSFAYESLNAFQSKLTIRFSEAPVGFTQADLQYSAIRSSLSQFSATADPREFSVVVATHRPFDAEEIRVTSGSYTDAAGNLGTGGLAFVEMGVSQPPPQVEVINDVPVGKVTQQTGAGSEVTYKVPVVRSGGDGGQGFEMPAGVGGQVLLPSGVGGTLTTIDSLISQQQAMIFLAKQAYAAAMQIAASLAALDALSRIILGAVQQSISASGLQLGMGPLLSNIGPVIVQNSLGNPSAFFLDATGALPGTKVELHNIDYALVTGQVKLLGGSGKQTVFADGAAQDMFLGEDDDELHGGGGNDTVGSAGGDDRLYGDDGDDRVFGGIGDDFLHGNAGADSVTGDDGHDILQGGKGDDHLDGGAGDDVLLGDLGDDTLTGGAGADVFVGLVGGGRDLVTDFNAAEGDRVRLASGYDVRQEGADTVITLEGGGQLVLANVQLATLPAGWIL
jgi:Ca2+-binding RTX toxin-like protein